MPISAIYIVDLYGHSLISRNYRGAHESNIIDKFMISMLKQEEEKSLTPVFQVEEVSFAYIMYKNLYFVCTINNNANMSLVFVFLYKVVRLMCDYFKEVVEESIRDNFVLIYELLDEILDFGYPQTTDSNILMEYITQKGRKLESQSKLPAAVTNAVSWRSEHTKYKKNELFLDVIESINLVVNSNGIIISREIIGAIIITPKLSGMPQLRLGLNDKLVYETFGSESATSVDLNEVKFHQCVRLCQFEDDRIISFIPPDEQFEVMSYRLNTYVEPPIWVNCLTEHYPNTKIEYTVKVTSCFKSQRTATSVVIVVPVPVDVDSPVFQATSGTVTYVPAKNAIEWCLKSLPGSKEYSMTARLGMPSISSEYKEQLPPIQVKFQLPHFAISGLLVKYLKIVEKSGYVALPWVRYTTQNGNYHVRQKEVVHEKKERRFNLP